MAHRNEPYRTSTDNSWYCEVVSEDGAKHLVGPYPTKSMVSRIATTMKNRLERVENAKRVSLAGEVGAPDGTLGWYARAMDQVE